MVLKMISEREHYALDGKTFAFVQEHCPQALQTVRDFYVTFCFQVLTMKCAK